MKISLVVLGNYHKWRRAWHYCWASTPICLISTRAFATILYRLGGDQHAPSLEQNFYRASVLNPRKKPPFFEYLRQPSRRLHIARAAHCVRSYYSRFGATADRTPPGRWALPSYAERGTAEIGCLYTLYLGQMLRTAVIRCRA